MIFPFVPQSSKSQNGASAAGVSCPAVMHIMPTRLSSAKNSALGDEKPSRKAIYSAE